MKLITLDIGNTKTKLDFFDGENLVFHKENNIIAFEDIQQLISQNSIDAVVICTVKKEKNCLSNDLKNLDGTEVVFFDVDTVREHGIEIDYSRNIGADRIAAFLGAVSLNPGESMLIADAGTALTLDISDKNQRFMGGNISLGLFSRLKALNTSTSLLPFYEELYNYEPIGHNTREAIEAGAINGIVGEIKYTLELARAICPIEKVVVTGGDAPYFLPYLDLGETKIEFQPHLVAIGMKAFYKRFAEICIDK